MSDADTPAEERPSAGEQWLIALSALFGALLAVMDVSIVNVALPHMMGSFGRTLSEITWVATSYSIAEILMATMAGWWSTVLGRKRLYMISFVLFTLGSALAGTSTTFAQMLCYRTIQGIGGGALIPLSLAILRETFPREKQGMAMSIYGMGIVLAPAMGPVVGGWLTDRYGWPWIFYVNIPFSVAGILFVNAFVHDPPYLRRGVSRVDWAGIALLTFCLVTLQLVLERGGEANWFESGWIVTGTVATIVAGAVLVVHELRTREPVVDLRLFRNVPFSSGTALGLIFGVGLYGSTFLIPTMTQNLLGYPAYDAGLVLLPRGLMLFAMMPLVGWLYGRVDLRVLIGIGIAVMSASFFDLSRLSTSAGFWSFVPPLLFMGVGMPFMFVVLTTVSVSTIRREDMMNASSLYTLFRRVGGNLGYALLATAVAHRSQLHRTRLVEHLTPWDGGFVAARERLTAAVVATGAPPSEAPEVALRTLDGLVNREASMLSFNDALWMTGVMFLLTAPLVFLFPGKGIPSDEAPPVE